MYRHTQIGWVTLLSLLAATVYCMVFALVLRDEPGVQAITIPMAVLFGVLTVMFATLTVTVADGEVELVFGPGPIRKRVRLAEVSSCREVSNPWWWGWGIRFTPHGWLFNVSGGQGVEISLKGGGAFRIGTDDPEGLCRAIRENLPR
jgi:hypothetical protein